jgi:uncharacterized protein YecE (DUF72 family)
MIEPYVGQVALRGDIAAYGRRFDLLEVSVDAGNLPRRARLRTWKQQVPERFVFSVRLPRMVGRLEPGAASGAARQTALDVAEALEARWLVLTTPAEVTPCARTRRGLRALADELPSARFRIAWEAGGLWDDPQEEEVAAELGWVVVRDLRRRPTPPGDVVYTRLLALGSSARQSEAALGRVAERIAFATEAYVVVEGGGADRVRDYFRQAQP